MGTRSRSSGGLLALVAVVLVASLGRARRAVGGRTMASGAGRHHGNVGRVSGTGHATALQLAHAPAAVGTGEPWPDWPRRRMAAMLAELATHPEVPTGERPRVALALVAHHHLETDGGNAEWGHNGGNIRRFPRYAADGTVHGDAGPAQTLSDGLPYRVYPDLAAGVHDYVQLVSHAHGYARPVWDALVAGREDPGHYAADLANTGYSGHLSDTPDPAHPERPTPYRARVDDVNSRAAAIRAALG